MTQSMNDLQAEIEQINRANGWYDDERSWPADISLLHSEVSEMVEAYRSWGLEDQTPEMGVDLVLPKPEGVGSEVADVLIRLLDTGARYGIDGDVIVEHGSYELGAPFADFTHATALLHFAISNLYITGQGLSGEVFGHFCTQEFGTIYAVLVATCRDYSLDLEAEVTRKLAFNRTRSYRHGGRTL